MFPRNITIIAIFITVSMGFACMGADEMAGGGFEDCPGNCPVDYSEVERCPLYKTCQEVPDCGDKMLCAPDDDDENDNQSPGDPDCDDPISCPDGTFEVPSCPEDELCTHITLCDAHLVCREASEWCQDQPLCPDDHRPVKDCDGLDDEYCYRNQHCSGPVDCLECHDDLPRKCPDDTTAVDVTECESEDTECERVETCDETLYCASPPDCNSYPYCPGDSEQVPDCDEDDPRCFVVDGCEMDMFCEVPDDDCTAVPTCPDDFYEVEIDECLDDLTSCDVVAECGSLAACLPME